MKQYDRTYAQINLSAIRNNIAEVRKNIRKSAKIMAIVKADAYGHGAVPVAKSIEDMVDAYGVAIIEEALQLRKNGIDKMILILGYTSEEWYEEVVQNNISQTIYTYEMAKQLSDTAMTLGMKTPIHIKLDTGMSRIGFAPTKENVQVVKSISQLPGIWIEGLFTHFARADENTIDPIREPFHQYMTFVRYLEKEGITIPVKHVSNSASIIHFPEANLDMVRSGITTYGLYPSEEISKEVLSLQPAMQWKAKISYVKMVEAGVGISYGATYTAKEKMKIATIPVGYADGMKRTLSNCGRVLIHGQFAPIVGRVCMDQFMVDVSHIEGVKEGDEVTLFGVDGNNIIPVEEIADLAHSFNYEFICGISHRVPRKYIEQ